MKPIRLTKPVRLFLLLLFIHTSTASGQYVSPPAVLLPMNGDTVRLYQPTFTWLPIMTSEADYQYKLTIVRILEGQTPNGAIQSNPPYFETEIGAGNNTMLYPSYAPALEGGDRYAWQIKGIRITGTSDYTSRVSVPSEVAHFIMVPPEVLKRCIPVFARDPSPEVMEVSTTEILARLPGNLQGKVKEVRFQLKWNHPEVAIEEGVAPLEHNGRYYQFNFKTPTIGRKKIRMIEGVLEALVPGEAPMQIKIALKPN